MKAERLKRKKTQSGCFMSSNVPQPNGKNKNTFKFKILQTILLMDQWVMDSAAERDPITTKKSNVSYIKNFTK